MTVCIAAIANNGDNLVLMTDRMITFNLPMPYQYETDDVAKDHDLCGNVKALTAGNASFALDIVNGARRRVTADQPWRFDDVAEVLRQEYQAYRRRIIIQTILEPRGLDMQSYYQNQNSLHAAIVQDVDGNLKNFDPGVEMLVAGHDDDGCRISSLHNPGILISHDATGFACIGIGAPHAMYYLIGSEYKRNLGVDVVTDLLRRAKEMSEKAPGVGSETVVFQLPEEEQDA